MLNICSQNVLDKYPDKRFSNTNKILSDINYDTQQIKRYWIQINKNGIKFCLHRHSIFLYERLKIACKNENRKGDNQFHFHRQN